MIYLLTNKVQTITQTQVKTLPPANLWQG